MCNNDALKRARSTNYFLQDTKHFVQDTSMVGNLTRISLTCMILARVDHARYLQGHARKWPYSTFIQEFVRSLARLQEFYLQACMHVRAISFKIVMHGLDCSVVGSNPTQGISSFSLEKKSCPGCS